MLRAEPDLRILSFNAALAIVHRHAFRTGSGPAVAAVDLWSTLKDVVGAVTGGRRSVRLRKILVTAQVAFSFLLLVGAGLFVRTLANLKQTNPGFRDIENVVSSRWTPPSTGTHSRGSRISTAQLLEKIRAVPGVKSAGYAMVPVLARRRMGFHHVGGRDIKEGRRRHAGLHERRLSGLLARRWACRCSRAAISTRAMTGKKMTVAIVNRKFATHFFGRQSAIGRHIGFGGGPKPNSISKSSAWPRNAVRGSARRRPPAGVRAFQAQSNFPAGVAFYVRPRWIRRACSPPCGRRSANSTPPCRFTT